MTLPFFPRWFQQRWQRACSLVLLLVGLWSGVGLPAIAVVPEVDLANATNRLQAIADELQFVAFAAAPPARSKISK